MVFIVFLPPLLYAAAGNTSWLNFKAARRPIGLLALSCVLFTTLLVATAAHSCISGFDWPLAFLVGAIVSPPDAVAAISITQGLGLPGPLLPVEKKAGNDPLHIRVHFHGRSFQE